MRNLLMLIFILTSLISVGQNATIEDLYKLYNSRDFKSAIDKTKPLLENDPNNIDLNLIMGRSYSDLADFKNAIPYLDLTVKNDKENTWRKAWALCYSGTCYFMLQDYDNSKKSTKECYELNVTKNVTQAAYKSMLIFGFDDFYKDWKISESDNFRFHFQSMNDSDIKNYVLSREEAYKTINKFFLVKLPKKIDFFVWDSREDAKKLLGANLGFADPGLCIVHSHYQQTKGHEMTHVISNYLTKSPNKTGLINEGTAVCFDQTNQNRVQLVKDWLKANNKTISVKEIWTNWRMYPEDLTYPLSGLFVKELIDNFGAEKFKEFFKNQTIENAETVFGDKLDQLIKDFENKINT